MSVERLRQDSLVAGPMQGQKVVIFPDPKLKPSEITSVRDDASIENKCHTEPKDETDMVTAFIARKVVVTTESCLTTNRIERNTDLRRPRTIYAACEQEVC